MQVYTPGKQRGDSYGDTTTENLLEWKVFLTVLHSIAIASTVFRISYRFHIRRLWWDDYLAVVPAILEIIYLVSALWLRVDSFPAEKSGFADVRIKKQAVIYWVSAIPFLCILWTSRMCLALSIARIFAPGKLPRRFALMLVVIFVLACIVTIVVEIIDSLMSDRSGIRHFFERPNCWGGKTSCIIAFIFEAIADCVLTLSPLFMLWHINLPRNQRYLIFAVFSASFWTLLVAAAYMLFLFSPLNKIRAGPVMLIMMPHIETAIAVFVSNLSVVVSFLYRTFRRYDDIDTVAATDDSSRTGPMMTTTSPRTFNSSVLVLTTIILTHTSVLSNSDAFEAIQGSRPSIYE